MQEEAEEEEDKKKKKKDKKKKKGSDSDEEKKVKKGKKSKVKQVDYAEVYQEELVNYHTEESDDQEDEFNKKKGRLWKRILLLFLFLFFSVF